MKPVILVIDDEEAIRLFLEATFEDRGYEVVTAGSGEQALALAEKSVPDLALLDMRLPDMTGLEVLARLKEKLPHLAVVMVTAYSQSDAAVQAMKLDAYDYVNKPIQLDKLLDVVDRALASTAAARRRYRHTTQSDLFGDMPEVVPSRSPQMLQVYDVVRKIGAGGGTTVLIEGESGVGKDVLANLIHRVSTRSSFPFLEINCAALPEALLESELFGHEKGAFTDAVTQKMGLLELANSGTLFLDEIGEMSLPIQVKLLRVLEKMTFRRVGGISDLSVDVRIVAATNRNLAHEVRAGRFREDLYYRLNVVPLLVPPLRSRPEDIQPLAEHFLAIYNERFGKDFKGIAASASAAMARYNWPGNIRELRNLLERAVLLEDGPVLEGRHLALLTDTADPGDLPGAVQEALCAPFPASGISLEGLVHELEEALVRKAFAAAEGNQSRAARLLGLNRDKFRYRMKQYGIREEV